MPTAVPATPLITIIDDDDSLRLATVGLVRSYGYDSVGYASAEDFLAQTAWQCACIISDIQMPGLSGLELARQLRARGVRTPLIMMTGRSEPDLDERAQASGALCLLKKPFDGDVLMARVREALASAA